MTTDRMALLLLVTVVDVILIIVIVINVIAVIYSFSTLGCCVWMSLAGRGSCSLSIWWVGNCL